MKLSLSATSSKIAAGRCAAIQSPGCGISAEEGPGGLDALLWVPERPFRTVAGGQRMVVAFQCRDNQGWGIPGPLCASGKGAVRRSALVASCQQVSPSSPQRSSCTFNYIGHPNRTLQKQVHRMQADNRCALDTRALVRCPQWEIASAMVFQRARFKWLTRP